MLPPEYWQPSNEGLVIIGHFCLRAGSLQHHVVLCYFFLEYLICLGLLESKQ